jgi:phage gpG-like protein
MMAGFSFDISCLKMLERDLGKIAADIQRNERAAVNLAGNAYKSDVQPLLQYKTGTLRRSVHVEPSEEGGHPLALIGTDVIYAKQREYGGVIRGKNGGYLRFKTYDGQWVTTKQVYQPPHPAWRPAFDNNKQKYRDIMIAALAGKPYAEGI